MTRRVTLGVFLGLLGLAGLLAAQPKPMTPDPNGPRPIEAIDSVFIEELTWMKTQK